MLQTHNEISFFIDENIDKFNIEKIKKNIQKDLCLKPSNFTGEIPEGIVSSFAKKVGEYTLETYKVGRSDFTIYIELFQTLSFGTRIEQMVVSLMPKNDDIKELIEEIILN